MGRSMEMKEEWLMPGAVVPVDVETTAALVAEIKRLIGVVGGMALNLQPAQHERVQPDSECKEDDGCPTEKAVLQRFWRKAQQQESVAFDVRCDDCGGSGLDRTDNNYRCAVCDGSGFVEKMLYTSPPYEATPLASQRSVKPWVGLTDEEVEATFWPWKQRTEYSIPLFEYRVIAQAIEAKLKEKNGF